MKRFLRMDTNQLVSRSEFVEYLRACARRWAAYSATMANQVEAKADRIAREGVK